MENGITNSSYHCIDRGGGGGGGYNSNNGGGGHDRDRRSVPPFFGGGGGDGRDHYGNRGGGNQNNNNNNNNSNSRSNDGGGGGIFIYSNDSGNGNPLKPKRVRAKSAPGGVVTDSNNPSVPDAAAGDKENEDAGITTTDANNSAGKLNVTYDD